MAYLAFSEPAGGAPYAPTAATSREAHAFPYAAREAGLEQQNENGFSALEWSVVAVAERDSVSTLRRPGRMSVAMGALFGGKPDPRLADTRLESLRRMAVLSWHRGYAVAPSEVRAFFAAGFSARHYEMLVDSIGAGRAASPMRRYRK